MASLPSRPVNEISFRNRTLQAFTRCWLRPTILVIAFGVASEPEWFSADVIIWIALVAAPELLPVPAWRGMHVSLGFPLLMAVGILFPPAWAGAIALIGSADPVEFRGGTTVLKAVFNSSQVALAVLLASGTFHALADVHVDRRGGL